MAFPKKKLPSKRKKRTVKRRVTRKAKLPNKSMVILGEGFPKKLMAKHRYHAFFQGTSTTGGNVISHYSCNGMFDPDITGVGHQPMYFDQLNSIYNHYVVIGSKITFKITAAAANNPIMNVTCFINDDSSTTPTGDALFEQVLSKGVTIPQGSNNSYTLSRQWSAKKMFGGSIMANTQLQGTGSANPAETQNYSLVYYCPTLGTSVIDVQVFIEYIAIWSEQKDMASS